MFKARSHAIWRPCHEVWRHSCAATYPTTPLLYIVDWLRDDNDKEDKEDNNDANRERKRQTDRQEDN